MKMLPILAVAFLALSCGSQDPEPVPELPLPLDLGVEVDALTEAVELKYGAKPVRQSLPEEIVPDGLRTVSYALVVPDRAAVVVAYFYFEGRSRVHSIGILNATGKYSGQIGGVPLGATRAEVRQILGHPDDCRVHAPVLDVCTWRTTDLSYEIRFFSQAYGWARLGDMDYIRVSELAR
jgi:hypothetical protein